MNINDLGTQLLYTTIPVWVEHKDGTQSSGTSFVTILIDSLHSDQFIPVLVTNHHVVANAKRVLIEFARLREHNPVKGDGIKVEMPGDDWLRFIDAELDIAAVPIGPILNQLKARNTEAFFRAVTPDLFPSDDIQNQLSAIEDVIFIGYPSGMYDQHNVSALIRRGITATPVWNDFGGKPQFLIDAGVFPGSSGSPVFIYNQGAYASVTGLTIGSRVLFLGILTGSIQRVASNDQSRIFIGLGTVTKSTQLRKFLDRMHAQITQSSILEKP